MTDLGQFDLSFLSPAENLREFIDALGGVDGMDWRELGEQSFTCNYYMYYHTVQNYLFNLVHYSGIAG